MSERLFQSYCFGRYGDQSYIPKSLDAVKNPEADVEKITSGQDTGDMLYQTITGLKDALPKVDEQLVKVDVEDKIEEGGGEKEEESENEEEESESESEEELGPEDKKAARKEHKKKVKEEKREARKNKTPKSVKKRKKKISKPHKTR